MLSELRCRAGPQVGSRTPANLRSGGTYAVNKRSCCVLKSDRILAGDIVSRIDLDHLDPGIGRKHYWRRLDGKHVGAGTAYHESRARDLFEHLL